MVSDALKQLKAWHRKYKLPDYDYTSDRDGLVWRADRDRHIMVHAHDGHIAWDCAPAFGRWRGGGFPLDGRPAGNFLKQLTAIVEARQS